MRKIRAALTAAAATATAFTMLTGPAQASPDGAQGPNCDSLYRQYKNDGYVRIYDGSDCTQYLDAARGHDDNWNDNVGPIESHANDRASSLLNTGAPVGIDNVQFWEGANGSGGTGCVAHGELYVDSLSGDKFSNGNWANNKISSHYWMGSCTNPWT